MKRGAVAFVEKPYQNDDLVDAIRMAMERHAQAAAARENVNVAGSPGSPATRD